MPFYANLFHIISLNFLKIINRTQVSSYNGGVTFTKDMINNLPLSKNYKNVYNEIVRLVDNILFNIENTIDITDIEIKITIMVYKLYELTYDEVLVVEPEFSLSKEEYDNFEIE